MTPPIYTKTMSLSDFFQVPFFVPASVQRGFEWDLLEVQNLLKELEQVFYGLESEQNEGITEAGGDDDQEEDEAGSSHLDNFDNQLTQKEELALNQMFLGTMVFHTLESSPDKLFIYDGLQRTATLTILFSVLRDISQKQEFKEAMGMMVTNDAGKHRLQLHGNDQSLIIDVQNKEAIFRVDKLSARSDVGKRIQGIKQFLKYKFQKWDADKLERFGYFLQENIWVNIVRTHDARLARQIFISTNLYGKRLKPISILKGQIGDLGKDDAETAKIMEYWDRLSQKFGDDFEGILKAVDMIYRTQPQGKQWPVDLGEHLKAHIKEGEILNWLERVESYGKSWKTLKWVLATAGNSSSIEKSIFRLKFLPWDDWFPVVLYYWDRVEHYKKTKEFGLGSDLKKDYVSFFEAFHRRCIGLVLVYGSLNLPPIIFQKVMQQTKEGQFATKWAQRGVDEVNGALVFQSKSKLKIDRTLQSQIKDYQIWVALMKWLEMVEWRDDLPELMVETQVEHVQPRNPLDGVADAEYDKICYSLGNLAVLDKKTNKKIENNDYQMKRPFLVKSAEKYELLKSVVRHKEWGEAEIMERAETLRNLVWKELRFKRPKMKQK